MKDQKRNHYGLLRGASLIEDRRKEIGGDDDLLESDAQRQARAHNPVTPKSKWLETNTPTPVAKSDGKTYTANTQHFMGAAEPKIRTPSEVVAAIAFTRATTPKPTPKYGPITAPTLGGGEESGASFGLENDGASPPDVKHGGSTNMGKTKPASSTPAVHPVPGDDVYVTTPRSKAPTTPKPF